MCVASAVKGAWRITRPKYGEALLQAGEWTVRIPDKTFELTCRDNTLYLPATATGMARLITLLHN